jgi:hypothetical protein
MKYRTGDNVRVHSSPVWRDRANYLFMAPVEADTDEVVWEQIWGEQAGQRTLVVCCIPFFVYDIALGDKVEIDDDQIFRRVVLDAGHWTFRVWFGRQTEATRDALVRGIESLGPIVEWYSENLLALSVPERAAAQELADYLQVCQDEGLLVYENGRSAVA